MADIKPINRSKVRLILQDLDLEVVGKTADWLTTLTQASPVRTAEPERVELPAVGQLKPIFVEVIGYV